MGLPPVLLKETSGATHTRRSAAGEDVGEGIWILISSPPSRQAVVRLIGKIGQVIAGLKSRHPHSPAAEPPRVWVAPGVSRV